jgi:uncharacterized phosphosugar-binding protein
MLHHICRSNKKKGEIRLLSLFFKHIHELLATVEEEEGEAMFAAAKKVAETVKQGGVIQLFGCGHSHLLAEEMFYRAGGLIPVKPMLIEPLMLHEGAVRSAALEKEIGYARTFLEKEDIRKEDIMFVISTSGRNPVPIDVALWAKERGAYVIGLTSLAYAKALPSLHPCKKHLSECVDLVINNHAVKGDAVLTHPNVRVPFAPTSTIVGAAILHAIFAQAVTIMAEQGDEPPVWMSGNIPEGKEHNQKFIERYKERIPFLY